MDRTTGQQVVRRTKEQENRTAGKSHWLTCIPIAVNVLQTVVIVLQLIYLADNVRIIP